MNFSNGQQSYVPKIEDHSILFYSLHPNDVISKKILEKLNQNDLLNKQFIKVCVYPNYQNIRIPKKILELNKVPVLVTSGFKEPILGENALSWLDNNAIEGNAPGGLESGSLDDSAFSSKFSKLDEEFKETEYNQFFNSEYNLGFGQGGQNELTNPFSEIKEQHRITTYDNSFETKKGISDKMSKKMNQMRYLRDKDLAKNRDFNGSNLSDMMDPRTNIPQRGGSIIDQRLSQMQQERHQMPQLPQMPYMPQLPYMPNVHQTLF